MSYAQTQGAGTGTGARQRTEQQQQQQQQQQRVKHTQDHQQQQQQQQRQVQNTQMQQHLRLSGGHDRVGAGAHLSDKIQGRLAPACASAVMDAASAAAQLPFPGKVAVPPVAVPPSSAQLAFPPPGMEMLLGYSHPAWGSGSARGSAWGDTGMQLCVYIYICVCV